MASTRPTPAPLDPISIAPGSDTSPAVSQAESQPYVLQFFRRVFDCCHTAAQLTKALMTLDHRLTPMEVEVLHEQHLRGELIPSDGAEKFQTVLGRWFENTHAMMQDSGKLQAEPFVSHRVAPTVTHFVGPGSPVNKTLLVCFPGSGDRQLLMPNAVLMQHTDSKRYDLLVIAEPLKKGYRLGVPSLGKTVTEAIERLGKLKLVGSYEKVRTIGCSAGGYPAVVAGYMLGAELAVSVGGRFHSERYPKRILDRVLTTWRAVRKGHCKRVLMSYAADKNRDRNYARIIARLTGGHLFAVEFTDGNVGHLILKRLVERGELAAFLERTVFANMDDGLADTERGHVIMSFPEKQVRPYR